jgi:hypothetical protein
MLQERLLSEPLRLDGNAEDRLPEGPAATKRRKRLRKVRCPWEEAARSELCSVVPMAPERASEWALGRVRPSAQELVVVVRSSVQRSAQSSHQAPQWEPRSASQPA